MSIWFSSDHHFGHANIIKYCDRPFADAHEMNVKMSDYWNELVMPDDVVYYLGDFSFNSRKHVDRLNGKVVLIRGNHDKSKDLRAFDFVCEGLAMKIGEFKCFLTHWPVEIGWKYQAGAQELHLLDAFDFIICGHVHEKWVVKGKNINVGVDMWDFKPIHIDDLVLFLRKIVGWK